MLTPPVEWVSARYHLFSTPALGPARMIQASAVSSPGVTTEPKTSTRMRPRHGMSVRAIAHAMGMAISTLSSPTLVARTKELTAGVRKAGVVTAAR